MRYLDVSIVDNNNRVATIGQNLDVLKEVATIQKDIDVEVATRNRMITKHTEKLEKLLAKFNNELAIADCYIASLEVKKSELNRLIKP